MTIKPSLVVGKGAGRGEVNTKLSQKEKILGCTELIIGYKPCFLQFCFFNFIVMISN